MGGQNPLQSAHLRASANAKGDAAGHRRREEDAVGVVIDVLTTPLHRGDLRLFGHAVLRAPALDGRLQLISYETSGVSPGYLDGAVERAQAVCSAR